MILGNDLSSYQGVVNWNLYRNNSNYAFLKASEGSSFVDPKFHFNQNEGRRVGLPLGYYHFSRADLGNTPEVEAEWFVKTIGGLQEGEVLCLDFEVTYKDTVNWCLQFLNHTRDITNGTKPIIYLNQSQVTTLDWTPVVNGNYGLWIAAFTGSPTNNVFKTGAFKVAVQQQWTNNQTVPGIGSAVDGDVWFGDINSFKAYGYHAPVPTPPPPTPCEEDLARANQTINDQIAQINQLIVDKSLLQTELADAQKNAFQKVIDYLNGILHPAPKTP